jgi:hypothetical protein
MLMKSVLLVALGLVAPVLTGAVAAQCPANLQHVASKIPKYTDPQLAQAREALLSEDFDAAFARGRSKGMSPAQMAAAALNDARQAEEQREQTAQCIAQLAVDPISVRRQVEAGTFIGGTNALSACASQYALAYMLSVAMREGALAMACRAR